MPRILLCAIGWLIFSACFAQSPALGAIRWDAWTGSGNEVGIQVEKALSPSRHHYRVPFFGVEVDTGTVTINGAFQTIMDQKIEYATYAGLSYWAFVWYASASGLDAARKLYYSSNKKNLIDYCLIIDQAFFKTEISLQDIIHEFQDPSYFRVLNGRPLLYMMGYASIKVSDIDSLRAICVEAGTGNPYIVELRVDGNLNVVDDFHMDALGLYSTTWINQGVPYKELADADIGQWNWVGINNGKKVVPHVTTGWDTRPIHDYPFTWYTNVSADNWVATATPSEIAGHIRDAISWVKANPSASEANTILIYAWNEHAEGGWLCPTLAKYGFTERIDTMNAWFGKQDHATKVINQESNAAVYPNPTSNSVFFTNQGEEKWSLSNLSGSELIKGRGKICDMSALERGVYIIKLNNRIFKVIKI